MRISSLTVAAVAVLVVSGFSSPATAAGTVTPANVDVSQRATNESEESVAVNPTNPSNIVIVSNVVVPAAGMFAAVSFDGGRTWATRIIGDNDNLGAACCDPSLSFDASGNLFLAYLYNVGNAVPVALSTDGGLSFSLLDNIANPSTQTTASRERRGLFRFVDQPTIVAAKGQVWVVFNAGGPLVATGAHVGGLGRVGTFAPVQVIPGTNNCTYGDIAIGPSGQVMQLCALTESGQGGGKLFVNVDPDGLGPAGFGDRTFVTNTHVGGFDFIAPQPDRSVDSEPGLTWDKTSRAHRGRVYLVYTHEVGNESDNTDVEVRYSDDAGSTWSAPVRVNDDLAGNSQFLPKISFGPVHREPGRRVVRRTQ